MQPVAFTNNNITANIDEIFSTNEYCFQRLKRHLVVFKVLISNVITIEAEKQRKGQIGLDICNANH